MLLERGKNLTSQWWGFYWGREGRKKMSLKWLSAIFLSSPWPGSHPILLLTPLPVHLPSLQCFSPLHFWHEILWDPAHSPLQAEYSLPMQPLQTSSRLQFYYMHLIVLTKIHALSFLQPNFIAPQGWKLCHIYFVCLSSWPPPRHPLKHNQANTCWMTKSFQYFYCWSITFFHLTLQVQKYIGKSHISKYSLPSNIDLSFLKLAITEPNFSGFTSKKKGISTQRRICYVTA